MRREFFQGMPQNIRGDQIKAAADRSKRHRGKTNRPLDSIEARIGERVFERDRIDIHRHYLAMRNDIGGRPLARAHQRNRDREHSRAGAGIEHAPLPMRPHQRLERAQRSGGGRMVPSAERLRRLDNDRDTPALSLATPRRHDQESFTNSKRPEPFHPQR